MFTSASSIDIAAQDLKPLSRERRDGQLPGNPLDSKDRQRRGWNKRLQKAGGGAKREQVFDVCEGIDPVELEADSPNKYVDSAGLGHTGSKRSQRDCSHHHSRRAEKCQGEPADSVEGRLDRCRFPASG